MSQLRHDSARVPEEDHGKRLDAALAELYPEFGLRARRRLWEWGRVLLDGREAKPGDRVSAGQLIEVIPLGVDAPDQKKICWNAIRLVTATDAYAAVFKPAGIPSARIGGSGRRSAEEHLREHWADFASGEMPLLCNRLDTATSGLLLLAFGQSNLSRFRALEAAGAVQKFYYALVCGAAAKELHLDSILNTDGRKKTLVFSAPDPDETRHTSARRLKLFKRCDTPFSLLEALIRRGARHQIRAHLASAGLPILGDALYGGEAGATADGGMYLHHHRVSFDGFEAEILPDWLEDMDSVTFPRAAGAAFQLL